METLTYSEAKALIKEIGRFEEASYDHWGLTVLDAENGEYAIAFSKDESDKAVAEYIKETAWAFVPSFIIEHSEVLDYDEPSRMIIKAIQEQYERGNEAILKLIDDLEEFVEDAIRYDGRGHFLSGYDGNEIEINVSDRIIYLYRIN